MNRFIISFDLLYCICYDTHARASNAMLCGGGGLCSGGYWWRPARTDATGANHPAQFVYAIGRLVPVFAPHAAPFDNTPTVSRQMSNWVTCVHKPYC